ncbi:MAG: hypothetical protein Q9181_000328 [Wetmoreana brouardii]
MIIIRSPDDVAVLWRKTVTFTFDPLVQNVMKAFGLQCTAVEHMFHDDPGRLVPMEVKDSSLLSAENPNNKCYFHMQKDWFRVQLHPGDKLRDLQEKYAQFLTASISWDSLSEGYTISADANERLVSMRGFTRLTLGMCALKAFFGKELFEICPSFLDHYQGFEDASWKVFYNYPHFLAKGLHKIKDKTIDDLVKYFALPAKQRPDLAWIFQTMEAELGNLSLSPRDRAGMMMLIIWAINHNAHKISFWVFVHTICDPALLESICLETGKAYSPDGSLEVEKLLSNCPHLDAVWYETLRIYNNAAVARKATANTTISGRSVRVGETVLGPFRQFHTDSNLFGLEASKFDSSRFLHYKNLHHAKGYQPFGGGNTYCPGRFFARSEVYIFVATALKKLDFQIKPGQKFPEVDLKIPSSSAMPAKEDILVTLKPRTSES